MSAFTNWQQQVLRLIRAPVTPQNVQLLNAWQRAEGGAAANNPLNTTYAVAGATDYNGVGVKNYATPTLGASATARTLLTNPAYSGIVADLRKGSYTPQQVLARNPDAFKTWGTGSSLISRVLGTATIDVQHAVSLLRPQAGVNLNGVDPSLVGRLAALAAAIGKPITITSGYRTPDGSVAAGGSSNDPHTHSIAVDALVDGRPIADVIPVATIESFGQLSGNKPGFWPGHESAYPRSSSDPAGADPVHVQLPASERTPGFSPSAQLASSSPLHWASSAGSWLLGHAGTIAGAVTNPVGTAIGAGADAASGIGGSLNPLNWTGEVTGWVESKIGYALLYGALVMFSIVLAIFGLLSMLGVRPRTVVQTVGTRAAVAAA